MLLKIWVVWEISPYYLYHQISQHFKNLVPATAFAPYTVLQSSWPLFLCTVHTVLHCYSAIYPLFCIVCRLKEVCIVESLCLCVNYITEPPRPVEVCVEQCIVSDQAAYVVMRYSEAVRVNSLGVYYKQALYKGLSEKQWTGVEVTELGGGLASVSLRGLDRATMYRLYVKAVNVCGESPPSRELWFRTASDEIEIKTT